ncbi:MULTISPECIES: superinfection exclusion B family protein [Ferrimonas]|uniref:superinfection exclusion B family protein n=1 Tax=Ferrimonas TaxID=44011 RepID=UPI000405FE56|nr:MULTISPECIES: superinfection exclusion B family protein [Ferrimonas]USD38039.1 superinfection exclusion B family protein [Ferrimonas sp. SCSIO 43195]
MGSRNTLLHSPTRFASSHTLALWLLITSCALLWLPLNLAQSLFLQQWISSYASWIGLTAVASGAYLATLGLRLVFGQVLNQRYQGQIRQKVAEKILTLDNTERAILREFVLQGKGSIAMPLNHHGVNELIESGILTRAGAVEEYAIEGPVAPLKITAAARTKLTRKVLRLPEGQLSDQQRERLLASRPEFAANLNRSGRHAA